MKRHLILTAAACTIAHAAPQLTFIGTPIDHDLSWPSLSGFTYTLELSQDLQSWTALPEIHQGTGGEIVVAGNCTAVNCYYRVQETMDSNFDGFLTSPTENQEINQAAGVRIGFDLSNFAILPEEIRISYRVFGTQPWNRIGKVTDFGEHRGVKHALGAAVWFPELTDIEDVIDTETYEIQVQVVGSANAVLTTAVRKITVIENEIPEITSMSLNSFSPPSEWIDEIAKFNTMLDSGDADATVRIDYFKSGHYFGTDFNFPGQGNVQTTWNAQLRLKGGTHAITAIAYDEHGAPSLLSDPLTVPIGGALEPILSTAQADMVYDVSKGDPFIVNYSVNFPEMEEDPSHFRYYAFVHNPGSGGIFGGKYDEVDAVADGQRPLIIQTNALQEGRHVVQLVGEEFSHRDHAFITLNVLDAIGGSWADILATELCDETTALPSNASLIGWKIASSLFSNGLNQGLEMDQGVLFTTGSAESWDSTDSEKVSTVHESSGDLDLGTLSVGRQTVDASGIEFDVFCTHGQLEIEFQLASEEYKEFINPEGSLISCPNDFFLITVDGVPVNLLPDASDQVGLRTVRPFIDGTMHDCTFIGEYPAVNEHLYIDKTERVDTLAYDGNVVKLKAHALVQPMASHRVKIVIGEEVDFGGGARGENDSALFLERASIRTVNPQN